VRYLLETKGSALAAAGRVRMHVTCFLASVPSQAPPIYLHGTRTRQLLLALRLREAPPHANAPGRRWQPQVLALEGDHCRILSLLGTAVEASSPAAVMRKQVSSRARTIPSCRI
jgi:hypothetical protein